MGNTNSLQSFPFTAVLDNITWWCAIPTEVNQFLDPSTGDKSAKCFVSYLHFHGLEVPECQLPTLSTPVVSRQTSRKRHGGRTGGQICDPANEHSTPQHDNFYHVFFVFCFCFVLSVVVPYPTSSIPWKPSLANMDRNINMSSSFFPF